MSSIQMVVRYSDHHWNTSPLFKWWSEYRTKFSPVFKWHSNNGPFGNQTTFDHLNTRLVRYSDPHCIAICLICFQNQPTDMYIKYVMKYVDMLLHYNIKPILVKLQSQSKLGSNCQHNLMSWRIQLGCGLDGCVRRRKVTITVTMQ